MFIIFSWILLRWEMSMENATADQCFCHAMLLLPRLLIVLCYYVTVAQMDLSASFS